MPVFHKNRIFVASENSTALPQSDASFTRDRGDARHYLTHFSAVATGVHTNRSTNLTRQPVHELNACQISLECKFGKARIFNSPFANQTPISLFNRNHVM